MTTLQGYVSHNETNQPPDNSADIATTSVGTFASTAKEAAMQAVKATHFEKTVIGTVGAVPFVAIDILKRVDQGQNVFEATLKSVAVAGAGVAVTALITVTLPPTIPVIIGAGIVGGLVSFAADKYAIDYLYNGAEDILNDALDTINSTSFDINTNGIVDIVSSATSGNLIPLLHGIQQGNIRIGSTTVYTHLTNSDAVAVFGNALKSIATTRVTVLSPVGNYEAQLVNDPNAGNFMGTSGNDTLIGKSEDDIFWGGDGDDHYETGGGYDVINDSDGKGSVNFNNKTLIGASKYPGESAWTNGSIIYEWAGTGVQGECFDLTVKNGTDTLVIENFHNGDLGIRLKMEEPTPPRHYTTEELKLVA